MKLVKTGFRHFQVFTQSHVFFPQFRVDTRLQIGGRCRSRSCRFCYNFITGGKHSADDLPTDFVAAMNDDVNVSGATAAIFTAIRSGNTLLSQLADRADSETAKAEVREALLAVRAMLDTLGLDPLAEPWVSAGAAGGAADGTAESPEHAALEALIAEQLNARAEARKAKDFAKADQIRDALTEAGIAIEDGPQGSTWSLK